MPFPRRFPILPGARYRSACAFFRLCLLICLVGFPGISLADIALTWPNTGSTAASTGSDTGFVVHNVGAAPVVFRVANPTTGLAYTGSGWNGWPVTVTGASGTSYSFGPEGGGMGGSQTIPPGEKRYIYFIWRGHINGYSPGTFTYTLAASYLEDAVFKTVVWSVPTLYTIGTPRAMSGSGANLVPAATPWPKTMPLSYTAGTEMTFGTIIVGSAPPHGKITVTGISSALAVKIEARLDGVIVASLQTTATDDPAEMDQPDLVVLDTATPAPYIGQNLKIYVNGAMLVNEAIAADFDGNFDIIKTFGPWEFPELPLDAAGDPLPVPPPTGLEGLGDGDNLAEGNPTYNRPDPGPMSGEDAAEDATVDSDGDGPGEGLSVRDIYRANRAALEDALHGGTGGPAYDFAQHTKRGEGEQSQAGKDLAAGLGGGLDALGGITGDVSVVLPTGGTPALYLAPNLTIHPPAGAPIIRTILLIALTVGFGYAMVSCVRGAFTTST